ncbi:hypothetical protein BZL54_04355 [Burkholderia ubonensis subsp. mesacidophila]|uniref:AB hydrolase-1 domain-containing protein n=1 Tax=Burkholderia ubonensis subsp. mesacidophila TaxID=265293 RepID=A0A2A4FLB4_9BURK|nr:hypothetical protein BZL54_04355 [Burkholderia ubonensis subsp. mesacidophila]
MARCEAAGERRGHDPCDGARQFHRTVGPSLTAQPSTRKDHHHDVTLVGFSMGCGAVARYVARHGARRVAKAALIGTVTPRIARRSSKASGRCSPARIAPARRSRARISTGSR